MFVAASSSWVRTKLFFPGSAVVLVWFVGGRTFRVSRETRHVLFVVRGLGSKEYHGMVWGFEAWVAWSVFLIGGRCG